VPMCDRTLETLIEMHTNRLVKSAAVPQT
jgi:hypothetical protein